MWRVVDISQQDRSLSLSRNAIKVSTEGTEIARIPIKDVQALLVHGHGATISLNLAAALADASVPVVLCGSNHAPRSILLPVAGNFEHAARLHAQASAALPLRKRLWADVVREKIASQSQALIAQQSVDAKRLEVLARSVRSGDPANVEAQAARLYWPKLLGKEFRRDRDASGLNGALNYGYTVLRAAMSRSVVAGGLSPALGIHHRSRLNAFQLVDDLMEPFRPLVDRIVANDKNLFGGLLNAQGKAELAKVTTLSIKTDEGVIAVSRAMDLLVGSLCSIYLGKQTKVWRPHNWTVARDGVFDFDA